MKGVFPSTPTPNTRFVGLRKEYHSAEPVPLFKLKNRILYEYGYCLLNFSIVLLYAHIKNVAK